MLGLQVGKQLSKVQPLLAFLFVLSVIFILWVWTASGFDSLAFDSDIGRDLMEISNIQAGRVVWLGPRLAPGLQASSVYYYLFTPILYLTNGHPHGLIVMNLLIGLAAIIMFGLVAVKKYHYWGIVMMMVQGCSKWMVEHILHPGNGYTYSLFSLIAVTGLWFELPLYISSFAAGMATAFHPAAFPLLPLLAFESWRKRKNILEITLAGLAFLIPWAPTIAFEIITKGYIIRSWLDHKSGGVLTFGLDGANLINIAHLLNVNVLVLVVLILVVIGTALASNNRRVIFWSFSTLFCGAIWLAIHAAPDRYLFTFAPILLLLISVTLIKWQRGKVLLVGYMLWVIVNSPLLHPLPAASRSMNKIVDVVNQTVSHNLIPRNRPIALVAATTNKTEVPQADDYRYLLRSQGYNVVDITQQETAQQLVMFVEVPDFEWQTWSSWEIDSFGPKKLERVEQTGDIKVIIFEKQ